jgi:hypothetical protein
LKRVLADHNVPARLARSLKAFDIRLADGLGLARVQNGRLLQAAEEFGFDVLLTGDQSLKYEQNMAGRKIGVVAMSDNHWNIVKDHVSVISDAVEAVQPGQILPVYCGKFIPRRFRKPDA